ncbi:MAG TPA: VirB8/TrbF family protein [Candidatus Sulfotelmatobacter sp.]|nr:VirB8/TrbF family protein [Candidatus Sulfotelmatobacter sp.]
MSRRTLLSAGTASANGHGNAGTAVAPRSVQTEDSPYVRGRAEFDSVFGDLARGKRNWQLVAFGTTAVAGVLAVGLVTVATQSRITPYVVEVDRLGRAQAFGPAERLRSSDQRVITSQLAGFVRDIRTVLADPPAQAELVRRAYAFVDQGAAAFLNEYFATPANDPRLLARDMTRLVDVTSVLPIPGGAGPAQTWKVSWTETSLPRAVGGPPTVTAWEGYFATRVVPPTTTERITLNPLGLYVTAINWTQLAERAEPGDAQASPTTAGGTQ